jgi:hypothetical protein
MKPSEAIETGRTVLAPNKSSWKSNALENVLPGLPADVLISVYGEHIQYHVQYPAQAGRQKAPCESGPEDGPKREFSYLRRGRILYRRPGAYARGDSASRPASEVRSLRPARRYESVAVVLGHES